MPNDSRKQHKSTATGDDILAGVPAFPDEYPQAHEAAEWLEKDENRIGKLHLQAVRDGKLPLRVQHLKNWPEEFLAVPEEVLDSSAGPTGEEVPGGRPEVNNSLGTCHGCLLRPTAPSDLTTRVKRGRSHR